MFHFLIIQLFIDNTTDGEVNVGVVDSNEIQARIKEMTGSGVMFSTFGVGTHYNENLMRGIASYLSFYHYSM